MVRNKKASAVSSSLRIASPLVRKRPVLCHSFLPWVDDRSRVLVLGSMPGPQALRKQQYYGFEGNHFWTIIPALFGQARPPLYEDRLALVREKGIALWDVIAHCRRPTALDSDIRDPQPNAIPDLLKRYPHIRAVFVNGQTAHKLLIKHFGAILGRPVFALPSTSPAHAAMPIHAKIERWKAIRTFL